MRFNFTPAIAVRHNVLFPPFPPEFAVALIVAPVEKELMFPFTFRSFCAGALLCKQVKKSDSFVGFFCSARYIA